MERVGDTEYVPSPSWDGNGFTDPQAAGLWDELDESLKMIAAREIAAGNKVEQILRDLRTGATLLAFERGPLTASPLDAKIIVHSEHRYGNYCYDGTKCTYEARETASFLAFADPDGKDESGF